MFIPKDKVNIWPVLVQWYNNIHNCDSNNRLGIFKTSISFLTWDVLISRRLMTFIYIMHYLWKCWGCWLNTEEMGTCFFSYETERDINHSKLSIFQLHGKVCTCMPFHGTHKHKFIFCGHKGFDATCGLGFGARIPDGHKQISPTRFWTGAQGCSFCWPF